MPAIPANLALLLADSLLALHAAIVVFVVGLLPLIALGGWRGWRWVRNRTVRIAHLLLIAFIVLQTWLGQLCPLTVWEQDLRRMAGQAGYSQSFIEYWLSRLLFFEAPWWLFTLVYTVFGGLVLAAWLWLPPRPRKKPA